jgi:hypothetical protein
MKTLTLNRTYDGVDYLGEQELLAYKWDPTNRELQDRYTLRLLFSSETEAQAYDVQARDILLGMINQDSVEWE